MKECLECKSVSIRFDKNRKYFICEQCGFTISSQEYYKIISKKNLKTKKDEREELYKWYLSSKK